MNLQKSFHSIEQWSLTVLLYRIGPISEFSVAVFSQVVVAVNIYTIVVTFITASVLIVIACTYHIPINLCCSKSDFMSSLAPLSFPYLFYLA